MGDNTAIENTAPGLDCVSMAFYHKCREVENGTIIKISTFIVLILKSKRVKEIKQYWPISLMSSVYKIIAKL